MQNNNKTVELVEGGCDRCRGWESG